MQVEDQASPYGVGITLEMIERYTIKFSPAVSQKELEKALYEDGDLSKAHHLKARIELIGEAEDIKKLSELLKTLKCEG